MAALAAAASGLSACTNSMLAAARQSLASGDYPKAHQQLETAMRDQSALDAAQRREAKDDLCMTEFVIGAPTYSLARQHRTCADAAQEPGSVSGTHLARIDAAIRHQDDAEIEHALKVGDIAGAVVALRRYQQIAPEDNEHIFRWNHKIWEAVAQIDATHSRHRTRGVHRTLISLREDYPNLRAMNKRAFKRWIGKDTSAAGVPMLSGIAISGHTLELRVPHRNLEQSELSPEKFARINDAFSVWCRCDGATYVASDPAGLPVYLARLNPMISRSEVLALPWR